MREVYERWNNLTKTKHVLRGLLQKHMWWMHYSRKVEEAEHLIEQQRREFEEAKLLIEE